jgi:hypothetical protein
MKRLMIVTLACVLLAAPTLFAGEWTGWITDEHCGKTGAKEGHGSCAAKCAKDGAALVLYNTADEKLYKLDDQKAAKEHAGEKVTVTGSVDGDTIKVESIAKAK